MNTNGEQKSDSEKIHEILKAVTHMSNNYKLLDKKVDR
jgi:hypothetical protein